MSVRLIVLVCSIPFLSSSVSYGDDTIVPESGENTARTYEAIRPCVGTGYLPYSYPAVGSCPCDENHCFHPHRYYCGGKAYKKSWLHKWVGTQFGKRSMLDDYPCECLYPTAVPRTYLKTVAGSSEAHHNVPPAPGAKATTE